MTSELAIWQQLLLLGLALLSMIYVLYFRIWLALATGSDLLFALALAVCVASIAAPALFDTAAERIVARSPLPAALVDADDQVAALEALPQSLIDRALARVGFEREELPEPPTPTRPGVGPFERQIRPAVEALLALVLRVTVFWASTFLLLLALSLRSSTSTARELRALSDRLDRLEGPVEIAATQSA